VTLASGALEIGFIIIIIIIIIITHGVALARL